MPTHRLNSLADQCLARLSAGPNALVPQHEAQVILGRGPALRKLLFRLDCQGRAIGNDGIGKETGTSFPCSAYALLA